MKTKVVRKKKHFRLLRFTAALFLISSLAYIASALFLRTYNNSLSSQKQAIDAQIAQLQVENDAVAVEVNTLNNRERVSSIASDDGLSLDQDNIVTITPTDTGE